MEDQILNLLRNRVQDSKLTEAIRADAFIVLDFAFMLRKGSSLAPLQTKLVPGNIDFFDDSTDFFWDF